MSDRLTGPSMLALTKDMTGPTLWRVLQPITALQRAGYPCGWDRTEEPGIGHIAGAFDGFVFPRLAWKPGHRRLAERWFASLRQGGRFVVYDADDDIFSSELNRRSVALGFAEGKSFEQLEAEQRERIWALQQCDGVTVSTQRLATVVRRLTDRPVIVVPNAIDVPWFRGVLRATRRRISGTTIGWAGGARPDDDLAPMATAWGRIAQRFPAVTFVVQGFHPAVIARHVPDERVVRLPWLPLERYPAGLAEVDIACAAVTDSPFNRSKSQIKAYEAAIAGAAVVATPTVYGSLIQHGHNGYLAETADEWETALTELVQHPAKRAIVATRLRKHVERKCSLAENLHRWPASWSAIVEDARARRGRLVAV